MIFGEKVISRHSALTLALTRRAPQIIAHGQADERALQVCTLGIEQSCPHQRPEQLIGWQVGAKDAIGPPDA